MDTLTDLAITLLETKQYIFIVLVLLTAIGWLTRQNIKVRKQIDDAQKERIEEYKTIIQENVTIIKDTKGVLEELLRYAVRESHSGER